jgi:hypothetical protein
LRPPHELADINEKLLETTAKIDAIVFGMYTLGPEDTRTVLDSLESTLEYRKRVLGQV